RQCRPEHDPVARIYDLGFLNIQEFPHVGTNKSGISSGVLQRSEPHEFLVCEFWTTERQQRNQFGHFAVWRPHRGARSATNSVCTQVQLLVWRGLKAALAPVTINVLST